MSSLYALLLALIPALLNLGILAYLLLFLPKGKTTLVFSLFVIALFLWQTEDILSRSLFSEESMRYWDHVLSIGWISVAPLLFHFVSCFTNRKSRCSSAWLLLVYLPFVFFYTTYVSNPQPVDFRYHNFWGWTTIPREGSFDLLQRYAISLMVVISLVKLFQHVHYLRGENNRRRMIQTLLIAIGILVPAVQGMLTQVIFPAYFELEVPVTSSFMSFFSLATIIALSRFHLFNLEDSLNVEGILKNLSSLVLIITPEGKIIFKNPQAQKVLGLTKRDIVNVKEILPEQQSETFIQEVIGYTLKGNQLTNYEAQFRDSSGNIYHFLLSADLVENSGIVQGILLVAHDITDQKIYLKAIEEQNRKLNEISWIQSHKVRAPLARILGLVGVAEFVGIEQAKKDGILQHIKDSADELDQVIEEVVGTSQPDELHPNPQIARPENISRPPGKAT